VGRVAVDVIANWRRWKENFRVNKKQGWERRRRHEAGKKGPMGVGTKKETRVSPF
jgi:hypothetical protein